MQVRLFRPFSAEHFVAALPESCRAVAVMEQTKEPGAAGEPLYLDVVTTTAQAVGRRERRSMPVVVGGRYGLASKDFNPAMVKAVFDELKKPDPRNSYTVGITDDVMHSSLQVDPSYSIEGVEVVRAVFYGLGADGSVGANKNTVKIIAEEAYLYAQRYFVYDSHKSGAQTVSHLRFGLGRSARRTSSARQISWPATNSTSSRGWTSFELRRRAPPSFSTAPLAPKRCGTGCRARFSSRSSTKVSSSLS